MAVSALHERATNSPVSTYPIWEILEYCRHLGIVKTNMTAGHWVARIRAKFGGYRQKRIRPWKSNRDTFGIALKEARQWFASPEIRAIASDPFPKGSKQGLNYCPWGEIYTVGHALEDYVQWKRIAATKTTFESVVSMINYHILPTLGHIPLDDLTGRHVAEFSLKVLETPPKRGKRELGPKRKLEDLTFEELRKRKKTLNGLIGILRLAVRLAWENGDTDSERAWRCIRRVPTAETPRTVFLTRSECAALLDCCRQDLREMVQGALYTGCRVTELSNMKVRDVAAHVFGVYVAPAKSRKPRYVFLPNEGMAFFLSLCLGRKPDDYVFRHRSGFSWQGRHKHLFKDAVRQAGLPSDFVFHGLRHTYASQLVQAGTPLVVIAQQLGHATTDTVSRTYGHLAPQIRETQIKTHFAELDRKFAAQARLMADKFEALSKSLQGEDWRDYGRLSVTCSWPRSNFVVSDKGVIQLLKQLEKPN